MFYITIIIWIILDFISKYFASIFLQEKIKIIWNFLFLKYVENTWIAFSINVPFLKFITIILILCIFYYYLKEEKKKNNKWIDLSFWLILAWAIWNWTERLINSSVIDFIWIRWFAVFNLADSLITIWAMIYLYILYKNNKK